MECVVSVIMAVFNGEKYLEEAILSILNQTYSNIELIIINDGSTDRSKEIIKSYLLKDKRIVLIDNVENKGLIYSLNKGIENAKGKYIARMDADDISLKERLQKQVKFMEENNDIVLSGTAHTIFLDDYEYISRNMNVLTDYEMIKAHSIFECSFVHPSIIMRSDIIKKERYKYKEKYKHAEDFGLWTEILARYKASNINEPLIKYRIVKNSVTRKANKNIEERRKVFKEIFKQYLNALEFKVSNLELDIHFEIANIQNIDSFEYSLKEKEEYLIKISENINLKMINNICAMQLFKNCLYHKDFNYYKSSPLSKFYNVSKIAYLINLQIIHIKKAIKRRYK